VGAAACAALATWCLVSDPAVRRTRDALGERRSRSSPQPAHLVATLVPLACLLMLGLPYGVVAAVVAAPVAVRIVGSLESSAARRTRLGIARQLPGAVDLMVAALAVGRPPSLAFLVAAEATAQPLGPELARVGARLVVTGDPAAVWQSLAAHPGLAPLGRAFVRAESSGMPVARIIAGVADDLRREQRARRQQLSHSVAVRTAAPLGVCFLPAFFLIGVVPTFIGTVRSLSLF